MSTRDVREKIEFARVADRRGDVRDAFDRLCNAVEQLCDEVDRTFEHADRARVAASTPRRGL